MGKRRCMQVLALREEAPDWCLDTCSGAQEVPDCGCCCVVYFKENGLRAVSHLLLQHQASMVYKSASMVYKL
eukprot:scaffold47753_cov14-Tisochrysis_lutea.AAC.1